MAEFAFSKFKHREKSFKPQKFKKQNKCMYLVSNIPNYANDNYVFPNYVQRINTDMLLSMNRELIEDNVFYIFFAHDTECVDVIRHIIKNDGLFIPPCIFDKTLYHVANPVFDSVCNELCIRKHPDDWDYIIASGICNVIDATKSLSGSGQEQGFDHLEIGVYMGRSAEMTLCALKYANLHNIRRCFFMDNFIGFNYETATNSSDIIWSNTHLDMNHNHLLFLKEKFDRTENRNYEIIKADIITDSLPNAIANRRFATVNIDVDMYEAIMVSLRRVSPLIVKSGIILVEDATSTPGLYGAFVAMTDFLETDEGKKYMKLYQRGQYLLIKMND